MRQSRKVEDAVPFDGALLRTLIDGRYGGVDELADAWHERFSATSVDSQTPDRSTIYRWQKGRWPRTSRDLLRLAALLDVDPICFLAIHAENASSILPRLYRGYATGTWLPGAISFLGDFVGQQSDWPPKAIATASNRTWFVRKFSHDLSLGKNVYARISLLSSVADCEHRPQTFHVAFRLGALFETRWVQYAYLNRHGPKAQLVSIDGQVLTASIGDDFAFFETWFGAKPAEFCVASLRDFEIVGIAATDLENGTMRI